MQNFPTETDIKFHLFGAVATLVLNPLMCFLSVPAIIFSLTAKSLYKEERYKTALAFAARAKRCTIAAWAVLFILLLAVASLYAVSHLSLI